MSPSLTLSPSPAPKMAFISSPPLQFQLTTLTITTPLLHTKSLRRLPRAFRFRVFSQSMTEERQIRKFSPFLEREFLLGDGVLASDEWKAVPDIWRSSAERYGDRVALVDPYHDPPSNMTYKQLEQEILDFSEGLRAIGVKPDEKLALFADNSCRWLIADQGIMAIGAINVVRGSRSSVEELLQIYIHSESVALAVDNPELFGRIAETFCSRAAIRFVVLLWGEKSCLPSEVMDRVPVFNYKEIIDLGRECRSVFLDSHYASKSIYSMLILYDITKFITMGIENHITNLAMWQKFEFWKFGKYGMWTIGINNWKHENQEERKKMRTKRETLELLQIHRERKKNENMKKERE